MNDSIIFNEGMQLLIEKMGNVKAEKFVTLINREEFDYTKWRKDLFNGMTVREISNEAMNHCKEKYPEKFEE